jgi:hypothetical protein
VLLMPSRKNKDLMDKVTVQLFVATVFDQPVDDYVNRKLIGMRLHESNPSIWSVDSLMVAAGYHLDDLFRWAKANRYRIWAYGEPGWHRRKPDWKEIDKTWPDPEAAE